MTDPRKDIQQDIDQHLRTVLQSTTLPTPENIRLKRFLDEYHALYPKTSPLQRLKSWLAESHWLPAPTIAAIASVLIVAQGVIIARMLPGEEHDNYRSSAVRCDDSPRIRVIFKPEALHAEVIILLRKVEAVVTNGPTETGEFWLKIPKGRSIEEASALLKSSALVDEAMIIESTDIRCP